MTADKFITLNDSRRIPWLVFGTGTALYRKDASDIVCVAIQAGITHLDGAQYYNNEDTLGEGIKASGKPREDLFITTKIWQLNPGSTVKESLQGSLQRLGLDYIDLFLIHQPEQQVPLKELWKGMEAVQRAGLARSIGVSNFNVEQLKEILEGAEVVPAVNQIELHPYVWKAAEPIVNFGKEHGIVPASYGGQTPVARVPDGPLAPVLGSIADKLGKIRGKPVTPGQVLSKWLHQKGAIVVTTTSKESRLKEFLDTIDVPNLGEDDMAAIDEAGGKLHHRVYLRKLFGEPEKV